MTRVRIRGIYATALTAVLNDAVTIVAPSRAIDRRFDESFEVTDWDVTVDATDDRQGISVVGTRGGVSTISEYVSECGFDVFSWPDPAPKGAVVTAEVIEELGRGAVVDLGQREGFLPYADTDEYVSTSDELRVQVHEPTPPWSDQRPVVGTDVWVFGGLVDLFRGDEAVQVEVDHPERESELIRTVEMIQTDIPAGWGVRFEGAAVDADLQVLGGAIDGVVTQVDDVRGRGNGDDPLWATRWFWFGRASRFEFDDRRRSVVATMPGHHRIKAGGDVESAAVDFVERLCEPDEFPVEPVLEQFGPREGDRYRIDHGKPDGRRFSLGEGEIIGRDGDTITVRREMSAGGRYDALESPREEGDSAVTKLREGRWWYPTVYRDSDGKSKGMYVNICTPVELFARKASYMDLEVDIIRRADGSVERVDTDELEEAVANGHVSSELAAKAREVATAVERALSK